MLRLWSVIPVADDGGIRLSGLLRQAIGHEGWGVGLGFAERRPDSEGRLSGGVDLLVLDRREPLEGEDPRIYIPMVNLTVAVDLLRW